MRREVPEKADSTRSRAILFLSLIVLVFNLAASGRQDFFSLPSASGRAAQVDAGPRPAEAAGEGVVSGARRGPLSLRQRFLVGHRVDVNRDGWKQLSELPGISDAVAREMVAARKRTGGFRSPDDLLAVKGIKERKLEKILPFLAGFRNN